MTGFWDPKSIHGTGIFAFIHEPTNTSHGYVDGTSSKASCSTSMLVSQSVLLGSDLMDYTPWNHGGSGWPQLDDHVPNSTAVFFPSRNHANDLVSYGY